VNTWNDWVDHLDLQPHPEGGYYREIYRSDETLPASALADRFDGPRNAAALIHFLLPGDAVSMLHRIRQDELWHFLAGAPLTLHHIAPDGSLSRQVLGRDVATGQHLQAVIPAGHWFGATVTDADRYALMGCTTAPAFDFADFELAERAVLIEQFPEHRAVIERLTPDP
jgi:predicted cupin superfamily sugar epimerase